MGFSIPARSCSVFQIEDGKTWFKHKKVIETENLAADILSE